jgi:hypothetical protein
MPQNITLTGAIGEFVLVTNAVKNLSASSIPRYRTLRRRPQWTKFSLLRSSEWNLYVTNPGCSWESVFDALRRFAAPGLLGNEPVLDGSTTYVPGLGPVIHYVDPNGFSVTNVTTDSHQLHPAVVFRQVYQDGD